MNSFKKNDPTLLSLLNLAWLALFILAMSLFTGKADQQSLQAIDSSLHARLALDATRSGLKPDLPIRAPRGSELGIGTGSLGFNQSPFNDHPFSLFYLNGWVMRLFGATAWSARFLPSLFGVGCIGIVAWLGALLYSPVHGLVAGLILMSSLPFANYSARFQLDPAMIFFILLSFVAWWKRKPMAMGIFAGLGLWMKNPLAFLIFPSALLSLAWVGKSSKKGLASEVKTIGAGLIWALGMGSLIWIMTGLFGGWDLVADYWRRQVFGTAVGGRGYQQSYDLLLFTEALRRRYWPWLPLLLFSLVQIVRVRRWRVPEVALPLSAMTVVIGVVSLMRFKFDHYYLPMYPFLALLCVDPIRTWVEKRKVTLLKLLVGTALVVPCFLLALPVELAPEMFPGLRKFDAIIQSYGTCSDKIVYVDGFQPYGSYGDYSVETAFYANRPFINATCSNAIQVIRKEDPGWILIFGKNFNDCLDENLKARFRTFYRFGNQFLLTRLIPEESITDLTPLARELRAPLDCDAAPLPQNRYYRYDSK